MQDMQGMQGMQDTREAALTCCHHSVALPGLAA